ncbi:MerC domain-containing protein [Sphingomonas sp. HF-S4]|uniref:MerC domain-containing protein n=1 Tax=Sphingomonas agrestis TaxID=3080540 RepID=A0ABU3Y2U8_9SPHN|nr:MerC domain-containing protein [Sphingomonas sp. HF-S4]MDV3455527.1 MerC domain-containing protein [Sphingomonas sp. HF-S4]
MPVSLPISRFWSGLDASFDRIAIGLSGLCLVHCVATTVLLTVLSSAGAFLHPAIHEIGLALAIVFGIIALGKGVLSHGYMAPALVGAFGIGIMAGALTLPHGGFEILWTLIGVSLVALGHDLNRRATY